MSDQPVPSGADAQFAAWMSTMEERMRALETAPRISSTSQRGGSYQLLDDDGNLLFSFGEYKRGIFDDYGILSRVPDGAGPGTSPTALEINTNGMEAPHIPFEVYKANDFTVVTSGSFANIWQATASLLVSDTMLWTSLITVDAATTAEARLESAGLFTDVLAIPTGSTNVQFKWLHGKNLGGGMGVSLQVRRASGAGNVNVYSPSVVTQAGSAGTGSTPGGL